MREIAPIQHHQHVSPQARPFRHLCPEADMRDAMDEGEFWEHVQRNLIGPPPDLDDYMDDEEPDPEDRSTCAVCGSTTACGFDAEGRAMIHADGGNPDD